MDLQSFPYFNPLAFFTDNPGTEEFFYALKNGESVSYEAAFSDVKDVFFPGFPEIKNYFSDAQTQPFGTYLSAKLIESQKRLLSVSNDPSLIDEREALKNLQKHIDETIRRQNEFFEKNDNPFENLPGSGEDNAAWASERDLWLSEKQKLKELNSLRDNPYTLHVALEDGTSLFINEVKRLDGSFDFRFADLITSCKPDVFTLANDAHYDPHFLDMRSRNKTTYIDLDNGAKRERKITLKRSVSIDKGEITQYQDLFVRRDNANEPTIQDPFLYDVYLKRRGQKDIGSILESIQNKQMDIVAHPYGDNLFVQGVAGSGKTMVLLQRLGNMLAHRDLLAKKKTVFIEPNKGFDRFFSGYFTDNNLIDIKRKTMAGYLMELVGRYAKRNARTAYTQSDNSRAPNHPNLETPY